MQNQQINAWLKQVTRHIPSPIYKKAVKKELTAHLEDKIRKLKNNGMTDEQAITQAIVQMGDADKLGKAFSACYTSPSGFRYTILCVLIWVMVAILSIYLIYKVLNIKM